MSDIRNNLGAIEERVGVAARAAGRDRRSITLIAVAKTFGVNAVQDALAAGQRVFGENRVQEAQAKYPALKDSHANLELHLIGPLQTNKVRDAIEIFDVIHTLDRDKLARELAKEIARTVRTPRLFVQVNIGNEPQKAGVAPAALPALLELCSSLQLKIAGLMCIPPVDQPPKPYFENLHELAHRHALAGLSMGMSGDFEIAIAAGATHIRVGSAIFGSRPPVPR
jgi:pyridoxal phosphate enzyme (YggS family)